MEKWKMFLIIIVLLIGTVHAGNFKIQNPAGTDIFNITSGGDIYLDGNFNVSSGNDICIAGDKCLSSATGDFSFTDFQSSWLTNWTAIIPQAYLNRSDASEHINWSNLDAFLNETDYESGWLANWTAISPKAYLNRSDASEHVNWSNLDPFLNYTEANPFVNWSETTDFLNRSDASTHVNASQLLDYLTRADASTHVNASALLDYLTRSDASEHLNWTTFPTCSAGEHLFFDGTDFTCTTDAGGAFDASKYHNKTDFLKDNTGWIIANRTVAVRNVTVTMVI